MKVVINKCYGGFQLSELACEELVKLGWTVTDYENGNLKDKDADLVRNTKFKDIMGDYSLGKWYGSEPELRTNPELIQVVERLGEKASNKVSELEVVVIPDGVDFVIEEYDGLEWISEAHRTWS